MKFLINVNYRSQLVYIRFCYQLLNKCKRDLISRIDDRKLSIRTQYIRDTYKKDIDAKVLLLLIIKSMKLVKIGELLCISVDEKSKHNSVQLYEYFKLIEYGAVGLEPYPLFRTYFEYLKGELNKLYNEYRGL